MKICSLSAARAAFAVVLASTLSVLTCGCADSDTSEDSPASDPVVTESDSSADADSDSQEIDMTDPAVTTPEFGPPPEGKVLRHAVFFSFKEDTSEEKIQEIVDAFRALPSKIEEIIDFQWGTNNSPEEHDDGFTHCFLLTFKDEAGRAAYLPHPAHKEFGSVLGGHNDKVFVIDYWGTPSEEPLEKELKHAVFFRFKDDASAEDITRVEEGFAALPSKIDAIKRFEWGINNSPERHSQGFTHCFMVTFDSEEGRAAYLPHPDHMAFVEILKPVLDAPRVLDFWAQK